MLFLDCEFNGHGGGLISMALVSTNGDEFYEVLDTIRLVYCNDWVRLNVVPFLGKSPIQADQFREKLHKFLQLHPQEIIVADSPADFIYLLDYLHEMQGDKYHYLNLEIKMQFTPKINYMSKIPHNALEDARAIKDVYLKGHTNYTTA